MTNQVVAYSRENGGRVFILFLLFFLALYEFVTAGFPVFAIICILPIIVLLGYWTFKYGMFAFWSLVVINYFVQFKLIPLPIPISLPNEMLQWLLLGIAIIDARQTPHFERSINIMLLAIIIWCTYCTIEVLNDTCGLGINIGAWYSGARMMAFQLLYIFLVFSIYVSSPEILMKYLKLWAILTLFSAFWTWKQQHLGLTPGETSFLYSTFSDAANYGCNAAGAGVAFIIFGITSKIKKEKLFFLLIGAFVLKSMFASGTRTAVFCMFAGFGIYVILSKSIKIAVPATLIGGLFLFILAFTNIGQGNQQIRRMRSAFDKNDASSNTRSINQATMRKYMQDAPWGIGVGRGNDNVPANNKYNKMATIPPDSEYVFIWLRTGIIGITTFLICTAIMLFGACWIVFFKLDSPSLRGIGAGFCCAFVSQQLGGYGNQVLMQFPNCLVFYGGLSIVYVLPWIEKEWIEWETKKLAIQEEKKRLKLEKKRQSRV